MGDMNGIPEGQTVESMAQYAEDMAERARVIAVAMQVENRGRREAGHVFHECDFSESPVEMSPVEARRIADAWYRDLRVRFPGQWVGDPRPRDMSSDVPEIAEIERVWRSGKPPQK